jgi:S1-C subfamily serine protease
MNERELIELLDKQLRGELQGDDALRLESILKDADARDFASKHAILATELRAYGRRQSVQTMLDAFHAAMPHEEPKSRRIRILKGYWPMAAVAASIALISVLFTWSLNQSVQVNKEEYQQLRGVVQRIEKSQNAIIKDIKEKEKSIPPGRYSGTGFFISTKGYLATSYHVIKDADSVYIENERLGSHKAIVIYQDAIADLALLKIESDSFVMKGNIPFLIHPSEAELGEDVYTLGFPREDIVFGEGSISASSGYRENPTAYQISIPVNPGNSGGPLFNAQGDLVGVISGIQTRLTGAAFAVKSTVLYKTIANDSLHEAIALPRQNMMRHSGRVEQVKKWKEYVVMVRVYN